MPLDKKVNLIRHRSKRPLIIVTNDDGIHSNGIRMLASALKKIGDVLIIAPALEQSATSHTVTLLRPLRCDRIAPNTYVVDGTPADCINLAVNFILNGRRPDLIFSGINRGPNLGDDVHYSGTVSAAIEGGIMGIPSVAVSVAGPLSDAFAGRGGFKFKAASHFATGLAKIILKKGLPNGIILNVNVPNALKRNIKGFKLTFQGKKNYSNIITEKIDPRGKRYYWMSGKESGFEDRPGSDCNAINEDYISITPIKVYITDYNFLKKMKGWKI